MIRKANRGDIPLILRRLGELSQVPKIADQAFFSIFRQDSVFIDDENGYVCRVALNTKTNEFVVVWLFPRADWGSDNAWGLARVLVECLTDSLARYPGSTNWLLRGRFGGLQDGGRELCEFWRDTFLTRRDGTRAQVTEDESSGEWTVWWTLANSERQIRDALRRH